MPYDDNLSWANQDSAVTSSLQAKSIDNHESAWVYHTTRNWADRNSSGDTMMKINMEQVKDFCSFFIEHYTYSTYILGRDPPQIKQVDIVTEKRKKEKKEIAEQNKSDQLKAFHHLPYPNACMHQPTRRISIRTTTIILRLLDSYRGLATGDKPSLSISQVFLLSRRST